MNHPEKSEQRAKDYLSSLSNSLHNQNSVTENIDIDSVHTHFEEADLTTKPIVFLEDAAFNYYSKAVRPEAPDNIKGIYASKLDTALVRRTLNSEDPQEALKAELVAVHELAHSAGVNTPLYVHHEKFGRIFKKDITSLHPQRVGFSQIEHPARSLSRGGFIEEGYAELERGLYVRNHGLVSQLVRSARNLDEIHESSIPVHYWIPDRLRNLQISPGAIGAATLELLIDKDPSLFSSLREGRRTIDGLRTVAQRVDAIEPGLYQNMRQIVSAKDARKLLSDVQDSLK